MVIIREALFEDAVHIAYNLRDADKEELQESGGNPVDSVLSGWQTSDWCKVAVVDGTPAVIWGVAHFVDDVGTPWMVATDDIKKIKKAFVMGSAEEVSGMKDSYSLLFNYVHRRNRLSQRWLQWLGFFLHKEPTGRNNNFYLFTWSAD